MEKKRKWDRTNMAVTVIFALFFGTLFVIGKPLYLGDTFQHEYQFVTREPVYALLIQFLRFLSPMHYDRLLILVQCLLAIAANSAFVMFLRKELQLKSLMTALTVLLVLAPHVMTPLASATNMVITNSLLSEGISFSLHLFFIKYLLLVLWRKETTGKNVVLALLWAVLLSLVRGQLMTLILVWFILVSVLALCKKEWKKIIVFALALVVAFSGRGLLVKTYNYCEQGLFVNTVSGKAMSVSNVLYVADREDVEAIQDEKLKQLFLTIYDELDANQLTYRYAPQGLMARAQHHEACHDVINFDYFGVHAKEYVTQNQGITIEDYQRMMIAVDEVAAALQGDLLFSVLDRYCYNYVAIASMGFVRSVAYVHPLLNWYTLLIFVTAVILSIVLLLKNKESKAAPFMLLVLLMIVGNVMATSLMLQCISRYMIYNFPLFYLAGLLMLKELYEGMKRRI